MELFWRSINYLNIRKSEGRDEFFLFKIFKKFCFVMKMERQELTEIGFAMELF